MPPSEEVRIHIWSHISGSATYKVPVESLKNATRGQIVALLESIAARDGIVLSDSERYALGHRIDLAKRALP